eukprot:24859_1
MMSMITFVFWMILLLANGNASCFHRISTQLPIDTLITRCIVEDISSETSTDFIDEYHRSFLLKGAEYTPHDTYLLLILWTQSRLCSMRLLFSVDTAYREV